MFLHGPCLLGQKKQKSPSHKEHQVTRSREQRNQSRRVTFILRRDRACPRRGADVELKQKPHFQNVPRTLAAVST